MARSTDIKIALSPTRVSDLPYRKRTESQLTVGQKPSDATVGTLVNGLSENFTVDGEDADSWSAKNIDHCGSRFVLGEKSPFRIFWQGLMFLLLFYIATIFLYRLSFCIFHIGPDGSEPIGEEDPGWNAVEVIVDTLFWIDLVLNFFISFKDERGREVDSVRRIARKYVTGFFWINLIACIPPPLVEKLMEGIVGVGRGVDLRVARVARVQRVSRILRLVRLTRLAKLASFKTDNSPCWTWFKGLRGVRIVNVIFALGWTVHLLACFWYLCAALHEDVHDTWVARRGVDASGTTSLLGQPPFEQWVHSMYFVLTVFSTVGFGDISAVTEAEILYVAFTMVVGAVVHSIVVGEVIRVITSSDRHQEFVDKHLRLIDAFSEHTELEPATQVQIREWIVWRSKAWAVHSSIDKDEMKELIAGKHMPRWLLGSLPQNFYGGLLINNHFMNVRQLHVPPRLPCLLAVHLTKVQFEAGEIIYQLHDWPFNIFLVLSGTFAHVGRPSASGGLDEICVEDGTSPNTSRNTRFYSLAMQRTWAGLENIMERSRSQVENPSFAESEGLFPYQLFSFHSYFGDVEMLHGRPRCATVRCETSGAAALTLRRQDFGEISEQFPQFAIAWRLDAAHRKARRLRLLARLTRGMNHRRLAAVRIQAQWRGRRGCRRAGSPSPECSDRTRPRLRAKANSGGLESLPSSGALPSSGPRAPDLELHRKVDAMATQLASLQRELRALRPQPPPGAAPASSVRAPEPTQL